MFYRGSLGFPQGSLWALWGFLLNHRLNHLNPRLNHLNPRLNDLNH